MKKYAFISRHAPTPEQHTLAQKKGICLVEVGDADAFNPFALGLAAKNYAGAVVVHPAAALTLKELGFEVGVFENGSRPVEGEKPAFFAKALHIY